MMRFDKETIEWSASIHLGDVHSFLKAGSVSKFRARQNTLIEFEHGIQSDASIDPPEDLIGVYVNSSHSCVIFTVSGIHWVENKTKKLVAYDLIASVTEPSDVDTHIDLLLRNGDYLAIPILNSTDDTPDVFSVYEFLRYLKIPRNEPEARLADVENQESLLKYLEQRFGIDYAEEMSGWLSTTTFRRWLEEVRINLETLERGETWRLIGMVLTIRGPDEA